MEILVVIGCLIVCGICKGIADAFQHDVNFRENAWKNKYKQWSNGDLFEVHLNWRYFRENPLSKWYYKTFNIKYFERFPLSATALVFLTDKWHLCNWISHRSIELTMCFLLNEYWHILWLWIPRSLLFEILYARRNRN